MARIEKRYCGFCSCERNVYTKAHIAWTDVLSCALLASLLVFIVWQTLDPRGFIFFALFLGLSEFIIQLRWRLSVSCPYCGFDPLLYKRSRPAAAEKVKEHLDRRRNDPNFVLSTKPFMNLRNSALRRQTSDQEP